MCNFSLKASLIFLLIVMFAIVSKAQDAEGTAPDCTRAKPSPLFKKKDIVKRTFSLRKNKEYPFEHIGTESVKLKNGDDLTIKNYGCHNYSLSFRFKTKRVSGNTKQVRLWYRNAVELMTPIRKILDEFLVDNGVETLNSYIKSNKKLKFDETIYFGGKTIESVVTVGKPKKLKGKLYEIEISFGIGPL